MGGLRSFHESASQFQRERKTTAGILADFGRLVSEPDSIRPSRVAAGTGPVR